MQRQTDSGNEEMDVIRRVETREALTSPGADVGWE